MLKELNEAERRVGPRINRKKTQFMKNAYNEDEGIQLEGSQVVETSPYIHLSFYEYEEIEKFEERSELGDKSSVGSICTRQGSYKPTDGPRSPCPSF
ncbi:hypothetical protein RB195_010060 [Necator americanus]|uniref:Uncharacterized protein n=1 Tax=Necator americanus TaxID=51031 RepID=A0ABR1CXC5_NECAM